MTFQCYFLLLWESLIAHHVAVEANHVYAMAHPGGAENRPGDVKAHLRVTAPHQWVIMVHQIFIYYFQNLADLRLWADKKNEYVESCGLVLVDLQNQKTCEMPEKFAD
jgi:hypothetical protein